MNHRWIIHAQKQTSYMASFKELQEGYKNQFNKLVNSDRFTFTFIVPIKIERSDDKYDIFMMLRKTNSRSAKYAVLDKNLERVTLQELITHNLCIVYPEDKINIKTNTIVHDSINKIYIVDGSNINIDMINYLRECNLKEHKNVEWININYIKDNLLYTPAAIKVAIKISNHIKKGNTFE